MKDKFILDACCAGRMIWFNKNHPNTLYVDIRKEEKGFIKERSNFEVNPDMIADFRNFHQFEDKSFKLVVFDPPHIKRQNNKSWISQKYGMLDLKNWRRDLKKGFDECWMVLEDHGILIFKWSEAGIKTKKILELFEKEPLFGHTTSKSGNTKWMCFMKIPIKELNSN